MLSLILFKSGKEIFGMLLAGKADQREPELLRSLPFLSVPVHTTYKFRSHSFFPSECNLSHSSLVKKQPLVFSGPILEVPEKS